MLHLVPASACGALDDTLEVADCDSRPAPFLRICIGYTQKSPIMPRRETNNLLKVK